MKSPSLSDTLLRLGTLVLMVGLSGCKACGTTTSSSEAEVLLPVKNSGCRAGRAGDGKVCFLIQHALQPLTEEEGRTTSGRVGSSIAASGGLIVVGAAEQSLGGADRTRPSLPQAGAVHAFFPDGRRQLLTASDAAAEARFGWSVALAGNTLFVGAHFADGGVKSSGAVYVFTLEGGRWTERQKLVVSDAAPNALLGFSLAAEGELLVVGAPGLASGAQDVGAAYVFRFDGQRWIEQRKLTPEEPKERMGFGWDVALSGDRILVAAPSEEHLGSHRGSAHLYRREGERWVEEQRLVNGRDLFSGRRFAVSVALEGTTALIGSPEDDEKEGAAGAAFVYRLEGGSWTLAQKLSASDATLRARFGRSVALSGSRALIGSGWSPDSPGLIVPGAAYVFELEDGQWKEQRRLVSSGGGADDDFGADVALSNGVALVTAPLAGTGARYARTGAVYLHDWRARPESRRAAREQCGSCASEAFCEEQAPRSFQCVCRAGFEGEGQTCHDLDECARGTARCHALATCTNTPGAYTCACPEGHSGDGVTCFRPPEVRLTSPSPRTRVFFGAALAVAREADDAILVGESGGSPDVLRIYGREGKDWVLRQTLPEPGEETVEVFGASVAVSGELALIGAAGMRIEGRAFCEDCPGAAYIYRFDGRRWVRQHTLSAGTADSDHFGQAVALDGNVALIGAPLHSSAYVYRFDGEQWKEEQVLRPTNPGLDHFGEDVALSGDIALVTSRANYKQGSLVHVYRFEGGTWKHEQQFEPAGEKPQWEFGRGLAISNGRIFVGAPQTTVNGQPGGGVLVFQHDGTRWVEEQLISVRGLERFSWFGSAVAVDGTRLLVGAARAHTGEWQAPGAAFLFESDGTKWELRQELGARTSSGPVKRSQYDDGLGNAVAFGRRVLVTAASSEDEGDKKHAGSVYVFEAPTRAEPAGPTGSR